MTGDTGTIRIKGLRAMGVHGVLPEERTRPQAFEVDIEIIAAIAQAGRSDSLDDTIDYSQVAAKARHVIEGDPVDLVETLASRICDSVVADHRVERVRVAVRKLHPPIDSDVQWVEAEFSVSKI